MKRSELEQRQDIQLLLYDLHTFALNTLDPKWPAHQFFEWALVEIAQSVLNDRSIRGYGCCAIITTSDENDEVANQNFPFISTPLGVFSSMGHYGWDDVEQHSALQVDSSAVIWDVSFLDPGCQGKGDFGDDGDMAGRMEFQDCKNENSYSEVFDAISPILLSHMKAQLLDRTTMTRASKRGARL